MVYGIVGKLLLNVEQLTWQDPNILKDNYFLLLQMRLSNVILDAGDIILSAREGAKSAMIMVPLLVALPSLFIT